MLFGWMREEYGVSVAQGEMRTKTQDPHET